MKRKGERVNRKGFIMGLRTRSETGRKSRLEAKRHKIHSDRTEGEKKKRENFDDDE